MSIDCCLNKHKLPILLLDLMLILLTTLPVSYAENMYDMV